MRIPSAVTAILLVVTIPSLAFAQMPDCLDEADLVTLQERAAGLDRMALVRDYARIALRSRVHALVSYQPMQEAGIHTSPPGPDRSVEQPIELPPDLLPVVDRPRDPSEEQHAADRGEVVRSSYECLLTTAIHLVRELEPAADESRCMLEDMHQELLGFESLLKWARTRVEAWDELHRGIERDLFATQDLTAVMRDRLGLVAD